VFNVQGDTLNMNVEGAPYTGPTDKVSIQQYMFSFLNSIALQSQHQDVMNDIIVPELTNPAVSGYNSVIVTTKSGSRGYEGSFTLGLYITVAPARTLSQDLNATDFNVPTNSNLLSYRNQEHATITMSDA
jgi:hypothetical protein